MDDSVLTASILLLKRGFHFSLQGAFHPRQIISLLSPVLLSLDPQILGGHT